MRTDSKWNDSRPGEGARQHPPDAVVPPPVGERSSRSPWRDQFAAGLAVLEGRQKPGAGLPAYTRWPNRRAARPLAAAAYASGLSPNQVTILSALVSLTGLVVLVLSDRSPVTGLVVALLLAFGFVLDSADGQLARLSRSGSPAGEWFDHVVDAVRSPSVHVAIGAALYIEGERGLLLLLPVAFGLLTVIQFFSQILADQLIRAVQVPAPESRDGAVLKSFLLLPADTGTICWLFALWGFPAVFVAAYTALFLFNFVHTCVSMARKYASLTAIGASR